MPDVVLGIESTAHAPSLGDLACEEGRLGRLIVIVIGEAAVVRVMRHLMGRGDVSGCVQCWGLCVRGRVRAGCITTRWLCDGGAMAISAASVSGCTVCRMHGPQC